MNRLTLSQRRPGEGDLNKPVLSVKRKLILLSALVLPIIPASLSLIPNQNVGADNLAFSVSDLGLQVTVSSEAEPENSVQSQVVPIGKPAPEATPMETDVNQVVMINPDQQITPPAILTDPDSVPQTVTPIDTEQLYAEPPSLYWSTATVKNNDSLISVFQRNNLTAATAMQLTKVRGAEAIRVLQPGDEFRIVFDSQDEAVGIEFRRKKRQNLMILFEDGEISIVDKEKAKQVGTLQALLDEKIEIISDIAPQESTQPLPSLDESKLVWHDVKVRNGDTLSHIFRRLGLSGTEAVKVANAPAKNWLKSGLKPKQEFRIAITEDGKFAALEVSNLPTAQLRTVIARDNEYLVGYRKLKSEVQEHYACSKIRINLYEAAKAVKLPISVVEEFANIFASRIDFSRQLRKGDEYCVIYDQTYFKGNPANGPRIIAAYLRQKNDLIQAFRYTREDGHTIYFDQNGLNMQGHFLRSPIKYARVTSVFSDNRFHPVLKKRRKHMGVDYGARTGTPVRATARGVVVKRSNDAGYGKMILLRHGSSYETLYAHMSKFGNGTAPGSRIKQGQVIGYVGKTGLSTGNHLHYEFRVNGVHRDPLNYEMPMGEPIAKKDREHYTQLVNRLSEKLNNIDQPMLAYSPSEATQ
jgi:murein DD-endopeptidase MepM/ murein hydrolase activator NlpD